MLDCEGIRLDPTYTGKTVAAVLDFCENRGAGEGPVLYWHTFNSADLGGRAAGADLSRLPAAFRPFLEAGDEA
jgi:D-cysteine desulfhydrase